jgi:hypothetical protein
MINKIILTLLVTLICCSALAQATQISVEPAYVEVSEGGIFTVNITVYPEGNETYGAQYTLSFDNTLLNATEQTTGPFLSQDGKNTNIYTDKINNTIGEIKYSEARTGVDYGVNDPGVLTTIEFEVICEHGTSGLLFDRAKLSRPNATYITGVVVNNGSVELVSGICGDVTGDGDVNICDVIRLANHVGFPADPSYYPADDNLADVTGDVDVNICDVIRLANHVGFPADPRYTPICG